MQTSFDLDYTDPVTHRLVEWALPTPAMLEDLSNASWKIVDVETTGLNPSSKEQNFSSREIRRGVNPSLRLRLLSVLYYGAKGRTVLSFDFDQLTHAERKAVSTAAMTNVVIAHNAGFDAYWSRLHTQMRPFKLLDSMLMSRVLFPTQPLVMAKLCRDENVEDNVRAHAVSMFQGGRSGWSLADLLVGRLNRVIDKGFQGPKNWCNEFLTQESYNYATGDTTHLMDLILSLFGLKESEVARSPGRLLSRYEELKKTHKALSIVEPQVMDIIEMREHGMPWNVARAEAYVAAQTERVSKLAEELVKMDPSFAPFKKALSSVDAGVTQALKATAGEAFVARGLEVSLTDKSQQFKVGEKDLRRVKAAINPDAKSLFTTWVALNRAKKSAGMAREVTGYAKRSPDGRLHPNTGHGPVTGRLSSSEPNCQQFPRDQLFRDSVEAAPGYKIVASDYSALDMRVGAALAIRAQRHIREALDGSRKVLPDVLNSIQMVFDKKITLEVARKDEARTETDFEVWKNRRTLAADDAKSQKSYWESYRNRQRALLLAGFRRCLMEVRIRAEQDGTDEWGSLRDAFAIPGMDIHTWTAMSMVGNNPKQLFEGLSGPEVALQLKEWKNKLGDVRQTGKVGNLSLLYAMKTTGLMDAAAERYDIHWTYAEADKVRRDWLASYVEIDLWHKWMELTPVDSVFVPDPERGMKFSKKPVYESYTLGGRLIYAFGLNAALSYEDQSTGADILGRVMDVLKKNHPAIFAATINQVHDELVLEIADEHVVEHTAILEKVMTECAEHYLAPFGVTGECTPAIGQSWVKD